MKTHLLFLLFFLVLGSSAKWNEEATALLSMKAAMVDPLGRLQTWKLPNNGEGESFTGHCNWTGVHCNANGIVEQLDLSCMNLTGIITDEIKNLKGLNAINISCNGFVSFPMSLSNVTTLESIDISQNSFVDAFPGGFVRSMAALTYLNASSNNFSGKIPEDIGDAVLLQSLDLRGNFFEGRIPPALKNLKELRFLGLSGNNLTGQIPVELGQLTSLESMILGYNEFDGGIPPEYGNLTKLKYLDLAVGNLGGEIPQEIGRLRSLQTLFLYNNNFEGAIPLSIGNMTSLKQLDLSDNMLTGEIPFQIVELKSLQLLNLMCNAITGTVPSGIADLPQLEILELWNNSMSGPLPSNLGENSPLHWLDISSNSFSGAIPPSLCSKGNLTKLILFNNGFSGPIPSTLSRCESLVRFRLQNNRLSGTIPVGFGKLGGLQRLELANNSLSGGIPNDIANSASLSSIDLSLNRLQSSLPSTILSIPNLQTFSAAYNDLDGEIPDQFQDCPSLSTLDLSFNRLSGIVPASIASCERLVNLNLRANNLTGTIPTALAMMPTLAILDLSNNSFTGQIPNNFGSSPALEVLNVSYNRLEGPVPTNGVLKTINPNDLAGNLGLCNGVLPPCLGSHDVALRKDIHAKHVFAGWIIGTASALAIVVAIFSARAVYLRRYSERIEGEEWPWRLMAFQRVGFTTSDILASIRESNVIGMGATGIVYKAEIPRSSSVVAVKKLWTPPGADIEAKSCGGGGDGSGSDLVGEVKLLGRLRHRNIVRLLGFLHNNTDVMIVYEFMNHGSLGEALHGKESGKLLVDWVSRYSIAVGVAQGLAYLHHDCQPPIIHRDIKSNNILLDANLEARIADFGLAKMMLRKNETVSMVAGSYGYIAPGKSFLS